MRQQTNTVRAAFLATTTLFFAWGLITSMLDPLVAAVRGIFKLSNVEAQLSAFAFFIAYGLISMPAATLVSRNGAVRAILLALVTMVLACGVMLGAANVASYAFVLVGLFLLASGITVLQVAANPLAAALGDPSRSHFRLTLSQTFNSFGTFIGPYLGAVLFLDGIEVTEGQAVTPAARDAALAGIDRAYFWICGLLIILLAFFFLSRKVLTSAAPAKGGQCMIALLKDALSARWALIGSGALFLYVGAEVAIGTQMALFLNSPDIWGQSDAAFAVPLLGHAMASDGVVGVSLQEAGKAVAFYWGGAMVGRAIGSFLLARFDAARLLGIVTVTAASMCAFIVLNGGVAAGFVALGIGLFNAVMFPLIFTLTLERSTANPEATSGLLCTAIVGGAIVPLVTGKVADLSGFGQAFVVPAACYLLLSGFAALTMRSRQGDAYRRGHAQPD
ncbi:MFS transporter [Croceicoccus gelatinilyticus]|uniref:MFS transporter n=1 Tax=Croceicoccus gelatinilyticus TaxID=2835536 RepID=UPI001BD11C9E|nr:MFS transporter [Croceicoccus gelatinilyticus]MBS7671171.1 MFS transporter [Croceicoccus gelatinilyticus]